MTRKEIIAMTEEEARAWIFQLPIDSTTWYAPEDPKEYKEFIRRHNMVYWDCGLSRMGISVSEPTSSGELEFIID